MTKNGRAFKLITKYNGEGNVDSVMEKPNVKVWRQEDFGIIASGAHVFAFSPEQNHVDFFQSGALVSKEYPKIRGSTNYGYVLSGASVII
jgi:hypothetical protein